MFLAGLAAGLVGCERNTVAAAGRSTASYALSVTDPAPVKAGSRATARVRVVPRGAYKINLEFPLKLKVSGPAAASPRELLLTKKQAAKLSKAELLLKPAFKLTGPGRHVFKGTLRFSVCTDAQCEIKTEKVAWTAVSR
jgi:hypothetical protein